MIKNEFFIGEKDLGYLNNMYQTLLSMFEWNTENLFDSTTIETYLITCGCAGATLKDNRLIIGKGSFCGNPTDDIFWFEKFKMTTYSGKEFTGTTHIFNTEKNGICVCANNSTFTPVYEINQFNEIMLELIKSLNSNIVFSRFLPVPVVHDEKSKKMYIETIKKLVDGEYTAYVSENILNQFLNENELKMLEISKPEQVTKIQYILQAMSAIEKKFYNRYGQALQTTDKTVQQTKDEVHGQDSVSFIIPNNMLNERKKFCERINTLLALNNIDKKIDVKYSKQWEREVEKYEKAE